MDLEFSLFKRSFSKCSFGFVSWMDEMDGWIDALIDGWMDGKMN